MNNCYGSFPPWCLYQVPLCDECMQENHSGKSTSDNRDTNSFLTCRRILTVLRIACDTHLHNMITRERDILQDLVHRAKFLGALGHLPVPWACLSTRPQVNSKVGKRVGSRRLHPNNYGPGLPFIWSTLITSTFIYSTLRFVDIHFSRHLSIKCVSQPNCDYDYIFSSLSKRRARDKLSALRGQGAATSRTPTGGL